MIGFEEEWRHPRLCPSSFILSHNQIFSQLAGNALFKIPYESSHYNLLYLNDANMFGAAALGLKAPTYLYNGEYKWTLIGISGYYYGGVLSNSAISFQAETNSWFEVPLPGSTRHLTSRWTELPVWLGAVTQPRRQVSLPQLVIDGGINMSLTHKLRLLFEPFNEAIRQH